MAFLAKAKKEDLRILAAEMGEAVDESMKIVDLRKLIMQSKEYEEEFVRTLLENIISARLEQAQFEEHKRKEEIQEKKRREEMEAEEQKRKDEIKLEELKLEQKRIESKVTSPLEEEEKLGKAYMQRFDIQKLVPKFNEKSDDISLFLSLFERQAKIMKIPDEIWVAQLVCVLPSDIIALIAREPETEAKNFEYVKKLLLKRFKLGPEEFRQKFAKHQKKPDDTWRDFYYDIKKFLEEWLEGLKITTFEQLKDLMIVDQIKRRTPTDARDHFIDIWSAITSPTQLAEKLDDYEKVRQNFKRQPYGQQKEKSDRKTWTIDRPRSPLAGKSWNSGAPKNDSRYTPDKFDARSRNTENKPKFKCFKCDLDGHVAKFCPNKDKNKNTSTPQANLISTENSDEQNFSNAEVLTAKISMPVAMTAANADALEVVNIKCAGNNVKGILDSGAQISVVRFDKVDIEDDNGQGTIKIVSAFGESEEVPLKICMLKIDDGMHGEVPITCAVSKKLISEMLICRTAFDALKENTQILNSERDFFPEDGRNVKSLEVTPVSHVEARENLPAEEQESCQRAFANLRTEDEILKASSKDAWNFAESNETLHFCEDGLVIHCDKASSEDAWNFAESNETLHFCENEMVFHCDIVRGKKEENLRQEEDHRRQEEEKEQAKKAEKPSLGLKERLRKEQATEKAASQLEEEISNVLVQEVEETQEEVHEGPPEIISTSLPKDPPPSQQVCQEENEMEHQSHFSISFDMEIPDPIYETSDDVSISSARPKEEHKQPNRQVTDEVFNKNETSFEKQNSPSHVKAEKLAQKLATWIFGAKVQIISDHKLLIYLIKTHPLNAKLAGWTLVLPSYKLELFYRKGIG